MWGSQTAKESLLVWFPGRVMGMEAFANKSTPGRFAQKITTPKKVLKKKMLCYNGHVRVPHCDLYFTYV